MTQSFKAAEEARLHSVVGGAERSIDRLKRVDVEVDEKACEYQQAHPDVLYGDAQDAVLASDPDLAKRYRDSFITRRKTKVAQHSIDDEDMSSINAGKQLTDLADAWLREHPAEREDFKKALQIVMEQHPDLAAAWKKSFNKAL